MPIIREAFNVDVTQDTIHPLEESEEGQGAHGAATLWVPSPSSWEVKIKLDADFSQILFGIACDTAVDSEGDAFSVGRGYFMYLHRSREHDDAEVPCLHKLQGWKMRRSGTCADDQLGHAFAELPQDLANAFTATHPWDKEICVSFRSKPTLALSFGIGDVPLTPVQLKEPVLTGAYWPCIIMLEYYSNRVTITSKHSTGKKRTRDTLERLADGKYTKLWLNRRFTDATIKCNDQIFPVHREVLAARSRVFASLFEGPGRESTEASINFSGEDVEAVAALLEHAYTMELPKGTDPTLLLPLADRFEMADCVDDCAEALEAMVETRPSEVLRTLRPYSADGRLRHTWDRVCDKVLQDRELAVTAFKCL